LTVPALAAPALAFGVDQASTRAAAAFIINHWITSTTKQTA
jgi:hypothetical protein